MKTNLCRFLSMACVLVVVLPANAEPPKKCKEPGCVQAPAPVDPNLNWKRLKVTPGPAHVEGGTLPGPEAALQKLKPSLEVCYLRSVVHGSKAQGSANFTLWLSAAGKVTKVLVAPPRGKTFAQDLTSCWSSAARGAHFERPSQEGVSVAFKLEFAPEQGAPEPPEPKTTYSGPVKVSAGGQISTSGEPLPDATLGVLHWSSTLKPCGDLVRSAPDASNGLLGAFKLQMTVAAGGKVSKVPPLAEIMAQQFHPDPLLQEAVVCVLEHAQLLHFAPRAGESQLRVGVEFRKAPTAARPAP